IVLTLLFWSSFSAAQAAPKYDPATETKLKGTVEELKLPAKENTKEVAHLMIKNGDVVLDIYLCPKSFIDDMGVTFAKGDEIAFTGSKMKQGDAEMILAREFVKGPDNSMFLDIKVHAVCGWRRAE